VYPKRREQGPKSSTSCTPGRVERAGQASFEQVLDNFR
jgi:hypothetical protein